MRRQKMKKRKSRKLFSKTAQRVHKNNAPKKVMRGGVRF